MPRLLVLALCASLLPAAAAAQTSSKFDAKALEARFPRLPVFQEKGAVVGNEVVVQETDAELSAAYVVRTDLKKVLGFYKEKLGREPESNGDADLGTIKYVFQLKPRQGDQYVVKAVVEKAEGGQVQITLVRRPVSEDDDLVAD